VKLVAQSIKHPIAVSVGVILLLMFGILALLEVPVQLVPDVDRPMITVTTTWPGAAPQEIEREIVEQQEKQLKSLESLVRMTSESTTSQGKVILEFEVGTDTAEALLRVNNQLQRVKSYPPNAEKPVLVSANQDASAIAWMVVLPNGSREIEISKLRTYVDEKVVPLLERVPGLAAVNLYGGQDREMQVEVDPKAVAAHKLTMRQIADRLVAENNDYSGGGMDEGKRRYQIRVKSRFEKPEDLEKVVLAYEDGAPVFLGDVGKARLGYAVKDSVTLSFGYPTMAMNAVRESGTNVLEVMAALKSAIKNVNREVLAELDVKIIQAYDVTEYINQAIALVRNNIFVGGSLAITVLLLFLRSFGTTFIIAASLPISLIGTFMMMSLFGRNINVISLAGLAFASGMVLDAAIVVLENIFRLRQEGLTRKDASYKGAVQVWGAILASTTTTIAVFLPVIRIQEEAGQLFADIAIAVSFSVLISLMVSITVIPTLASRLVGGGESKSGSNQKSSLIARFGGAVRRGIVAMVRSLAGSVSARLAVVSVMTCLALATAWFLTPKAEYLPTGNRNFLLGVMVPPPGYNVAEYEKVGKGITARLKPHWGKDPFTPGGHEKDPAIKSFFFVGWGSMIFMGVSSWNETNARGLIPPLKMALAPVPGMISIVNQSSLFERGAAQGRTIDLEITGPDLDRLVSLGGRFFGQIMGLLPGCQIRPIPGLELSKPELRFEPDRVRAAAVGLTARDVGFNLDVLCEGSKIDEVSRGGYNIDLKLMAAPHQVNRTQDLGGMQLNTPLGSLVTLESVAPPRLIGGPTQINHIERQRAVTLRIYPPEQMPLEEAMDLLNKNIVQPLLSSGQVSPPFDLKLSGTADDLSKTYEALKGNFFLAMAITFLLMAALFGSYLYPLVIMFTVPLAAAGGVLGLWLVNHVLIYQPLDVLTMLGFIILIGIVVNNAILLVDQTLRGVREDGLTIKNAVAEAVHLRVRPIFMSTLTSVFGMMPLVLMPGAGSELYRGLGAVVVGGLIVSTLFTLIMMPCLLSLVLDARQALARLRGKPFKA
jgi:HAE1 family hydrophobic/amphiphilic exporter-1